MQLGCIFCFKSTDKKMMMEFLVLGQIPGTDLTLDFWSVILLWLLAIVLYKSRSVLKNLINTNRSKFNKQIEIDLLTI